MFKKAMIAGAVLAAAFGAQAQSSASWNVTATIDPAPCTISLVGDATYGILTGGYVKGLTVGGTGADRYYNLPTSTNKTVAMTINCDSPTKVAFTVTDGKAGSAIPNSQAAFNGYEFGLGTTDGVAKIGHYFVVLANRLVKALTTDTAAAPPVQFFFDGTPVSGTTWTTAASSQEINYLKHGRAYTFGTTAVSTAPDAIASFTSDLSFRLKPGKDVVDALTAPLNIAGSGTLTLVTL